VLWPSQHTTATHNPFLPRCKPLPVIPYVFFNQKIKTGGLGPPYGSVWYFFGEILYGIYPLASSFLRFHQLITCQKKWGLTGIQKSPLGNPEIQEFVEFASRSNRQQTGFPIQLIKIECRTRFAQHSLFLSLFVAAALPSPPPALPSQRLATLHSAAIRIPPTSDSRAPFILPASPLIIQ
jgi:hypothetical protein